MTVISAHHMVVMTAITVPVPPSSDGSYPGERCLAGIGLFIASLEGRRWRFTRHASIVPAGEPEHSLLEGVADRLPADGMLIGWDVDSVLVPALLAAAEEAPAAVAHHFTARLHRLLSGGVVDMALVPRKTGGASLATTAADMAIYAPSWNADAVFTAWSTGMIDQVHRDLADEALAIWRTFVRSSGLSNVDAEAATDAWVARKQPICVAKPSADGR